MMHTGPGRMVSFKKSTNATIFIVDYFISFALKNTFGMQLLVIHSSASQGTCKSAGIRRAAIRTGNPFIAKHFLNPQKV